MKIIGMCKLSPQQKLRWLMMLLARFCLYALAQTNSSPSSVVQSRSFCFFLNEGFQMKCTKEFQSTERKRNRTGEGKACSLHGCTNSDFWATEQSKEETMIKEHF